MQSVNVILICPCCASPVDAVSASYLQTLICGSCEQTWLMIVDHARQAEHSLA